MPSIQKQNKLTLIFFGLGSIGTRLARIIRDNYDYKIYAFRSKTNTPNNLGLDEVYEYHEIKSLSPHIAFITNPTSIHLSTAIKMASMGTHLFIEKPLSNDLAEYDELARIVRNEGILTYIGCNLRFDPMLQFLKKTINVNDVFYSKATCSSYLPDWRPGQDYKTSYSAKREYGGGVILDVIHEPDYCHWLFGNIEHITGSTGKCSTLELETEDFADMMLSHSSGIRSNIHVDYFSKQSQRKIEIYGSNLYIEADLIKRSYTRIVDRDIVVQAFEPLGRDSTYEMELTHFFDCIDKGIQPMNGIEEHVSVLKPLIAFKQQKGW
jgi:predicted dehydrogenase